ncbi:hypothetical protein WY02_03415 [Pseudonocardia sp. AL041005-10]|nr:hypothetical protein WY02_03415 [Pseudonocardia sp. AL041005-10]
MTVLPVETGTAAAAVDDALAAADSAAAAAAADQVTADAAARGIVENDAGVVDPELGPGPSSRWTDAKAAEAGRRLDELSNADPNGPLMTCLKAGNLYEDC